MRKILSLVGLSVVGTLLGCGGVFRPFAYAEPDNCALNPGVCGAGSECNFQREVCEPSVALPQVARPVWRQQAKLSASDGGIGDFFGAASALSGDTVLLGAPFSDVESTANAGAAYAFVLDPDHGVWKQQAKLVAGDAATGALAGYALALAGDTHDIDAFDLQHPRVGLHRVARKHLGLQPRARQVGLADQLVQPRSVVGPAKRREFTLAHLQPHRQRLHRVVVAARARNVARRAGRALEAEVGTTGGLVPGDVGAEE